MQSATRFLGGRLGGRIALSGISGVTLPRPGPSWQNTRLRYNPENRLLTPAQRREISRRDGYQCSTPDCPNKLWLHTHHIACYAEGGMTVPDNLLTVCSACHRNLHNGNLKIERKPHRLRYTDKAGRSLRVFRAESAPDWALNDVLDAGNVRPVQEDCRSARQDLILGTIIGSEGHPPRCLERSPEHPGPRFGARDQVASSAFVNKNSG